MAKKKKPARKPKRKPRLDLSQNALRIVEDATGQKLKKKKT